jgi:hypothetical protein
MLTLRMTFTNKHAGRKVIRLTLHASDVKQAMYKAHHGMAARGWQYSASEITPSSYYKAG